MSIPFEPILFGYKINLHLFLEYTAFFVGYRYYVHLRKKCNDTITTRNRLSIILGAAIGALLGSRIVGFLENPMIPISSENLIQLLNTKTIMGGLFGGLIGVELMKKRIGEKQSSGDLFVLPIIVGIFIGRIGCFLAGVNEFTYGTETDVFWAMNLGDGVMRHPIVLYELLFLTMIFLVIKKGNEWEYLKNGDLFKGFMICYFTFRFLIEFLKPNTFYILGLSTIQIVCILCLIYYHQSILNIFKKYARKKLYLL